MKLKANVTIQYSANDTALAGDIFEISAEHGAPLVEAGHAEEVKAAKPETAAEKKAREAAEKAAAEAADDAEL